MSDTLEHTARRIAERGRPALIARLRPAFEEAAAAHKVSQSRHLRGKLVLQVR